MSAATPTYSSIRPSRRIADLLETVRWAPAPRWGHSAAEHGRYVAYLAGSMLAWTLIGVGGAALLGQALGLLG
ncbi:MAG: chemotaxis protein CheW [Cellulomonas sp.]